MFTLPNVLTLLRLALVPLVAYLLVRGQFQPALAFFVLAGLTDLIDGLLARRLNQRSVFGAWLDPAADKALIVMMFTLLTALGHIPHWLLLIVALRDILIVTAIADLYLAGKPPAIRPLMVSKATTAMQIIYLAMVLAHLAFTTNFDMFVDVAGYLTAALTGLSFLAYFKVWLAYRRGTAATN
ncbi:MAG: CDP-alcohol phosphatidyltransferase family protein [Pseudomonadota bacterium]